MKKKVISATGGLKKQFAKPLANDQVRESDTGIEYVEPKKGERRVYISQLVERIGRSRTWLIRRLERGDIPICRSWGISEKDAERLVAAHGIGTTLKVRRLKQERTWTSPYQLGERMRLAPGFIVNCVDHGIINAVVEEMCGRKYIKIANDEAARFEALFRQRWPEWPPTVDR